MRLTVQVTLAGQDKTPSGVLRESVEHMVEEADAGVYANSLRLGRLRSVALAVDLQPSVGLGREGTAIEVERQLDLGLVCVASESCPAGRGGRCRAHNVYILFYVSLTMLKLKCRLAR